MTASLAYRKNEAAIRAGDAPEKYTRILPHIPGERILEVGSAEGVLALLLARQGREVTALEMRRDRHDAALALHREWAEKFLIETEPCFVCGAIGDRLDLLEGIDTLVAVRMVYYLRDQIDTVFAEVARKVPIVVLCGNRNRAARYHAGTPDEPLGEFNFYAGAMGMTALLTRHGYRAETVEPNGDAIVVGVRA